MFSTKSYALDVDKQDSHDFLMMNCSIDTLLNEKVFELELDHHLGQYLNQKDKSHRKSKLIAWGLRVNRELSLEDEQFVSGLNKMIQPQEFICKLIAKHGRTLLLFVKRSLEVTPIDLAVDSSFLESDE